MWQAQQRRDRTEQGPVLRTSRMLEGRMSGDIRPSLFLRIRGQRTMRWWRGRSAGDCGVDGTGGIRRSPQVAGGKSLLASGSDVTRLVSRVPTSGHFVKCITLFARRRIFRIADDPTDAGSTGIAIGHARPGRHRRALHGLYRRGPGERRGLATRTTQVFAILAGHPRLARRGIAEPAPRRPAVVALAFRAGGAKDDEDRREIMRFLSRELDARPAA